MDEELETRENTEGMMLATDQAATFEPFEAPMDGDIPDMSDDDIAAALGFTTTLSEPLLPQDEMTTAEDEVVETADESPETEMEADEEMAEESEEVEEEPEKEEEKSEDTEILESRIKTLEMEVERLKKKEPE